MQGKLLRLTASTIRAIFCVTDNINLAAIQRFLYYFPGYAGVGGAI
jgi:hypothetical protein